MEPITDRFILTLADCVAASKYLASRKSFNRWINLIILVFLADILWNLRDIHTTSDVFVTFFPFLLLVAVLKIFIPIISRRGFGMHPEIGKEMVFSVTDDSIRLVSDISTTDTQWKAFKKVVAAPEAFIFMLSSRHFHILPTRAFSSPTDIENLKTLCRQHANDFKEVK